MKKIHIFSSPEERARGLQFYSKMDKNELALFIEPEPKSVVFNNKNVDFDISISFYNKSGELIKMETLPNYSNGLKQVECDNAKYIIEKTAGLAKWIPKNYKTTRNVFAGVARKPSKFVEKVWNPIDPSKIHNTKYMPLAKAEYTGRLTVGGIRNGMRGASKAIVGHPDVATAAFLGLANDIAFAAGAPVPWLPILKAYGSGKWLFNQGKKLIRISKPISRKSADKAEQIMYKMLPYTMGFPK